MFKYGYIYKITNLINSKIYIGQVYNKSIELRFVRHYKSINSKSSLIDKSILKYGKDNFKVEQIDLCYSIEDCNEKEIYWIKYYNSNNLKIGYNLTTGGEGGNTYINKSKEELDLIKLKISIANCGKNNGMSKLIKCKSIKSNLELHFDTLTECLSYFNIKNKGVIIDRANNKNTSLFRNEWLISFEHNEYMNYDCPNKSTRGLKVKLYDLSNDNILVFNSRNKLYKYLNINHRLVFKDNKCNYKNYKLELLN